MQFGVIRSDRAMPLANYVSSPTLHDNGNQFDLHVNHTLSGTPGTRPPRAATVSATARAKLQDRTGEIFVAELPKEAQ